MATALRAQLEELLRARLDADSDLALIDLDDVEAQAQSQINDGFPHAAALDSAVEGALYLARSGRATPPETRVVPAAAEPTAPSHQPTAVLSPLPSLSTVSELIHDDLGKDWRPYFLGSELRQTLLCNPPDPPAGFTACLTYTFYLTTAEALVGWAIDSRTEHLVIGLAMYGVSFALFYLLLHTRSRNAAVLAAFASGALLLRSVTQVMDGWRDRRFWLDGAITLRGRPRRIWVG
jgi:hypothetical protein